MKRLLIAGALAFAAAGQALAADLPQPAPPPPQAPAVYVPTVAPVYNWGGIYFGGNGGYGFGSVQIDLRCRYDHRHLQCHRLSGLAGTIGANFQTDAFVFGVEGDFDGSWLHGTSGRAVCGLVQCETKNSWLGTLRGRVGYAADRVLFYGTAGGAFGNIEQGSNGWSAAASPVRRRPVGRPAPASRPHSPTIGPLGSSTCSSILRTAPGSR